MGACTSAPGAVDTPAQSSSKLRAFWKGKGTAIIKAEASLVSTPEVVYLTAQPSWTPEDSTAAIGQAGLRTSQSFRIKTEGMSKCSFASSAVLVCSLYSQEEVTRVCVYHIAHAEDIPEDQLRATAAKESQAPTQGSSNTALATIDSLASSIEERKVSDGSSLPPSGLPQSLTPSTAALLQNVSDPLPGHQTSRLDPHIQATAADGPILASVTLGDSLSEDAVGISGQVMDMVRSEAQPGALVLPRGQPRGGAASLPDAMSSQRRSQQDGPPASRDSEEQPSGSRGSLHSSHAGLSDEAGMLPSPSRRPTPVAASSQEAQPIGLKRQRTGGEPHTPPPPDTHAEPLSPASLVSSDACDNLFMSKSEH